MNITKNLVTCKPAVIKLINPVNGNCKILPQQRYSKIHHTNYHQYLITISSNHKLVLNKHQQQISPEQVRVVYENTAPLGLQYIFSKRTKVFSTSSKQTVTNLTQDNQSCSQVQQHYHQVIRSCCVEINYQYKGYHMSNNNHEQSTSELQDIKNSVSSLLGMVSSLMHIVGSDNFKQESYMKLLAKQQSELQQKVDYLSCYHEVRREWDDED